MILQKIIIKKKEELPSIKNFDPNSLTPSQYNFKACLKGKNNIIAEIKKKSPSECKFNDIDVRTIADIYNKYANAISIVTDKKFFDGDINDIKKIREMTRLPILRKDFIIDEKQILESRYYQADAILLIASILSIKQINRFIDIAKKYSMDCLVEVHTEGELRKVLRTSAEIIGINNRNLLTFDIDMNTTKKLKKLIPNDKIVVSESGFNNVEDIKTANVNAVLVGTSLMRSYNKSKKLKMLRTPKVKICGITKKEDANDAIKYGADFLGFNFYSKSSRYITPKNAKKIIEKMPNTVVIVGVFVNETKEKVKEISKYCKLDMLQFHGHESSDYCNDFNLPVIKAFRIKNDKLDNINPNNNDNNIIQINLDINKFQTFAFLFDTFVEGHYGGTGKAINAFPLKNIQKKLFLSGGLNCDNIQAQLNGVDPYCVDVCSGVEKYPGIKDKHKLKKFIELVKNNDK